MFNNMFNTYIIKTYMQYMFNNICLMYICKVYIYGYIHLCIEVV